MGNSNSITKEECSAKLKEFLEEGKETGKRNYIKKMNEKKDIIFNMLIEGLKSEKFKETIFSRMRRDKNNYITYISNNIMRGHISVPDIDDPTDEEKREYISRISDNVTSVTEELISKFDRELTSEINDEKVDKLMREWDQGMELLLEIIEKEKKPTSKDVRDSAEMLGNMFYVIILRGDLHKDVFNRHKGVTYNPPYIDGSAGRGDWVEPFVNGVEDENKFSKILLVLIVVVLFLHLFTDFKIF